MDRMLTTPRNQKEKDVIWKWWTARLPRFKRLHAQVRDHIVKHNEIHYKQANKHRKHDEFKYDDFIWVQLREERFLQSSIAKLKQRAAGPFKVPMKIGNNACKIELLAKYEVSNTFSESELSPFHGDIDLLDSRTSLLQPGEFDAGARRPEREEAEMELEETEQANYSESSHLQLQLCTDWEGQKLCVIYGRKAL